MHARNTTGGLPPVKLTTHNTMQLHTLSHDCGHPSFGQERWRYYMPTQNLASAGGLGFYWEQAAVWLPSKW